MADDVTLFTAIVTRCILSAQVRGYEVFGVALPRARGNRVAIRHWGGAVSGMWQRVV